ncbi:hypothetical protein [uncultured Kiloniella sp.]|uniref:hypothetical protein n=1 Tax=uncultured Kiloniella sp. TaxID=1133091 RepID=UPI0026083CCF|nr:hypothetical protein [uncultured Kiloniella sp.]
MWNPFKEKEIVTERVEPILEAAGVTVGESFREAKGEPGYTKLSDTGKRDLNPVKHRKMQEMASLLWQKSPLARSMSELPVAYLLGEGLKISAKDPEVDKAINSFWKDPITRMDITLPRRVRDLGLLGEQCWPVFVNKMNGHVRMANLDPSRIATVLYDPDNSDMPIGVISVSNQKGIQKRYRTIVNGSENVFGKVAQSIRKTLTDGDCFYFDVNRLSEATRGTSDILPSLDWLIALDRSMFGEIERVDFQRAYIWDVLIKGASQDEIEARAKKTRPPAPGSVRMHNESEEWNAVSPDIKAGQNAEHVRTIKNYAAGSTTMPEHWFGGGGDVNRATAESMHEPVFKRLSVRQTYLKHVLEQILLFVALKRLDPQGELPDDLMGLEDLMPTVEFPEMTSKDVSRHSAALQQIVVSCVMAIDNGLLSKEKAVSMIGIIAKQIGIEINPEDELRTAKNEITTEKTKDFYSDVTPKVSGEVEE